MAGLIALTFGLFLLSLIIGPAHLSPVEVFRALFTRDDTASAVWLIVREIRLPRSILAVLVGGALGVSGAALQGYLRNPLAEPGIIGASGGAALGAVLAFYFGLSYAIPFAVPFAGLLGAGAAVITVYLLAGHGSRPLTLILAGVAISAFTAALTSLTLSLSPNPFAMSEVVFWLMGSLADRSMNHVYLAAPLILAGCALLLTLGRAIDGLSLGEDVAANLGVNLRRTQILLILGIAMSVGAATAVAGAIAFVGLIAPHILRPFTDGRPSRTLSLSFFGGASLVIAADCLIRVITPERELNLGVLTALLGAPFFLVLILRMRGRDFA
ncbi:FecCD family ABC transporter permease [Methyloligella halotolerans]|uniref:FecCD family ABC transporter permease n=1 Tax=Methyloligella halotolerans TaxID=1177755 RepID=UPI00083CBD7F|nr:iron ABC transporter permease [Methyloligella halotolerans]